MTKKGRIPEREKLARVRPSGESNHFCAVCDGTAGSGPVGSLQKLESRSPDFSGNSRSGRQIAQKLEAQTRETLSRQKLEIRSPDCAETRDPVARLRRHVPERSPDPIARLRRTRNLRRNSRSDRQIAQKRLSSPATRFLQKLEIRPPEFCGQIIALLGGPFCAAEMGPC